MINSVRSLPKISVCMLTYNQRDYVRQALDGIISQRTTFPFELIIHDDCSTDGTREIILEYAREYPSLITLLLSKENQYRKGIDVFSKCVEAARGKYLAWCEGDDEWIYNKKLQLEFDYLEQNPQCSLVYTNADIYIERENRIEHAALTSGFIRSPKSFKEHLKVAGHLAPLTWLFRKDCYSYPEKRYVDWSYSIALDLFAKGEVHFINKVTAVYRIFNQSVSNSRTIRDLLNFGKGIIEIKEEYFNKYFNLLSIEEIDEIRSYTYSKYFPAALAIGDKHFLEKFKENYKGSQPSKYSILLSLSKFPGIKFVLRFLYKLRGRN